MSENIIVATGSSIRGLRFHEGRLGEVFNLGMSRQVGIPGRTTRPLEVCLDLLDGARHGLRVVVAVAIVTTVGPTS